VDLSDLPEISPTNLIYDRIRDAISDRRLRPGTRLKEEQLSGIFGVSRARVRQALTALEHDGLVTILPNRGAIVAVWLSLGSSTGSVLTRCRVLLNSCGRMLLKRGWLACVAIRRL
jgi:DNA-binding FadR family transcriptional regulator